MLLLILGLGLGLEIFWELTQVLFEPLQLQLSSIQLGAYSTRLGDVPQSFESRLQYLLLALEDVD